MLRHLFVTCFCTVLCIAQLNAAYYISEPLQGKGFRNSGNNQHANVGSQLSDTLRFYVSDSLGYPAAGRKVYLDILYSPGSSPSASFGQRLLFTDSAGIASTTFRLGDKPGEYAIIAKLGGASDIEKAQFVAYRFYGRAPDWLAIMAFGLLGGLAFFLYGIHIMSEGLKRAAGSKMKSVLEKLTGSKIAGLGLGTIGTVIIPSSSAISVMLVSFVNAGIMKFKQTLPVILGAAVGTTIIAQLIAFKLSDFSLLIIAAGALSFLFGTKAGLRDTGLSLLGFGVLFFGMDIMSGSMEPLRTYQPFIELMLRLDSPVVGLLLGAAFTALIQSSSAFIGLLMILAGQGLISIEMSLAFVLGANLGTPATAIVASIKTAAEAKKVAAAQFFYKLAMVLIFIWLLEPVASLLVFISPSAQDAGLSTFAMLPRQIANGHTLYSLVLAALALPFTGQFALFIDYIFKKQAAPKTNTKYLNYSVLSTPAIAIELVKKEIARMWGKLLTLNDAALASFVSSDNSILAKLETERESFKAARDETNAYLVKILQGSGYKNAAETYRLLQIVTELSHVNDLLTKQLHRRAEKWIERNYAFTNESRDQIVKYYRLSMEILRNSLSAFSGGSSFSAAEIDQAYQNSKTLAREIELDHYQRMITGAAADSLNSKTYIELLNVFRLAGEHGRNISALIGNGGNSQPD
jgi:phosphate:Na+ symporter